MSANRKKSKELDEDELETLAWQMEVRHENDPPAKPDPDLLKICSVCETGTAKELKEILEKQENLGRFFESAQFLVDSMCSEIEPIQKVKVLLDLGANPNVTECTDVYPLTTAAHINNPEVINVLLKAGAKIDQIEIHQNWTALMTSAAIGSSEAVKILLEYGADVSLKSIHGYTAIDLARLNKRQNVMKVILKFLEKKLNK